MQKLTTHPSSQYWTENGRWYAHITVYVDEECQAQIQREFETELQASKWRETMMQSLRDVSVKLDFKRQILT